jgi:hypothetical protein
MNTEAKVILALIILIVTGFVAFVFFSKESEQNPANPNETPTSLVNTSESKSDGEKLTEIVPTQIKPVEVKPVPAISGQTSSGSPTSAQVKPTETKSDTVKPAATASNKTKPGTVKTTETKPAISTRLLDDLIQVTTPLPNEEISSPVIIEGRARGFWFFEASFPVMLSDSKGNIIARGVAAAKADWMTEDFVPFSTELKFTPDYGKSGVVILRNDNPSDLQENNRQLTIPVFFSKQESIVVKVFFGNTKLDPDFTGNKVFSSQRVIPKTQAIAKAALEELLKGPTVQEKNAGFFTTINPDVKIQKLSIIDGIARVDFNSQIEFQVGGSARVGAIRAEITQTLMQFSTVKKVIISVDGRTEDILQP